MYLLPFMDRGAKARGTEASNRFYNILSGCPKDTQGLQELSETSSLPLTPGIAGPLRADCPSSPGTVNNSWWQGCTLEPEQQTSSWEPACPTQAIKTTLWDQIWDNYQPDHTWLLSALTQFFLCYGLECEYPEDTFSSSSQSMVSNLLSLLFTPPHPWLTLWDRLSSLGCWGQGLGIRSKIVVTATTSPGGSGGVLILHIYRIRTVKMDSFPGKLANATTKW